MLEQQSVDSISAIPSLSTPVGGRGGGGGGTSVVSFLCCSFLPYMYAIDRTFFHTVHMTIAFYSVHV